jgi:hypothetical protein
LEMLIFLVSFNSLFNNYTIIDEEDIILKENEDLNSKKSRLPNRFEK